MMEDHEPSRGLAKSGIPFVNATSRPFQRIDTGTFDKRHTKTAQDL